MPSQPWSRTKRVLAPVGVIALLLLVCSVTVASAAGSHGTTAASRLGSAGRTAQLPLSALNTHASLLPGRLGEASANATASTIGAGQYTISDLATAGATFTMPAFSCASDSDTEWLLPGVWIFDSSGALESQVDVNFNCNYGTKYQQAIICITGGTCDSSLTVNPGDVIEAVFVQTASTAAGEIIDRTQHTSATAYGTVTPGGHYVLTGDLGPSSFGVFGVPTFTKVAFSTATVNGFYVGDWVPATYSLQSAGDVQIKSSAANTTKFVTKFVHNN